MFTAMEYLGEAYAPEKVMQVVRETKIGVSQFIVKEDYFCSSESKSDLEFATFDDMMTHFRSRELEFDITYSGKRFSAEKTEGDWSQIFHIA